MVGIGNTPESGVVNGQLLPLRQLDAYDPTTFGPWLQGGRVPVPTGSPVYGQGRGAVQDMSIAANPVSLKSSPLVWSIAFLIIGLVGLHLVHWHNGD